MKNELGFAHSGITATSGRSANRCFYFLCSAMLQFQAMILIALDAARTLIPSLRKSGGALSEPPPPCPRSEPPRHSARRHLAHQIGGLRWNEIDRGLGREMIVLQPERTKNKRLHELPLSRQAMAIIERRDPRIANRGQPRPDRNEFVF